MNGFEPTRAGFGYEKPVGGETNEWLTPPGLLKILGPFDLDPCAVAPWLVEYRKDGKLLGYNPALDKAEAEAVRDRDAVADPSIVGPIYQRPWPTAETMYSVLDDGLRKAWEGRVFANPPYSSHVVHWAKRMREHGNGILLIFSRTETEAWRTVWQADAVLFPYGRISFYLPSGQKAKSGTAPSALLAYGQSNVECLRTCGLAGTFITGHVILEGRKASSL